VRLTHEPAGSEDYDRWSTMFAPDFPSPATWQLFTQWHHMGSNGSPPASITRMGVMDHDNWGMDRSLSEVM
jgi:hypothetical protein